MKRVWQKRLRPWMQRYHWPLIGVAAVGCSVAPLADWDAGQFQFTPAEVELMAKMEHERWMAERLRSDWKSLPGAKDIEKKTGPHVVPWEMGGVPTNEGENAQISLTGEGNCGLLKGRF
ncbi:MAG: hypothetical protein AB1715_08240 [Acidobacteriota bacterium]